MQRSKHFTLQHAVHPLATNASILPVGSSTDKQGNRSSSCKEGLCLCRDILLLFGVTLAFGWLVGGMAAKFFVDLVTR